LREAVEGSLKRLRLDRIDVYNFTFPIRWCLSMRPIETLANMQSEGKIRLVGLSNVTVEHIERGAGDRADRVGPEPLQFRRSRMG